LSDLFTVLESEKKTGKLKTNKDIISSKINFYEPPTELKECYKIMYEQQKELANKQNELQKLENRVKELEGVKKYTVPDVQNYQVAEKPIELNDSE